MVLELNIAKLSEKLGCEVVEISALKGTGIKEAAEKAVSLLSLRRLISLHINSVMKLNLLSKQLKIRLVLM